MRLRQLFAAGVDIVLPPQSLLTGDLADIDADTDLWTQLNFLDEPCCYHCGFPFEFDEGDKALCVRCSIKRPPYEMARAPFCYDDKSRSMVLGFKHGGRTEGLPVFAAQMKRAGRRFLDEADFLIPVPLHFGRRVQRRYNQAALLARSLAKISAPDFAPDILLRHKSTPSQGGLSAAARRRNVQSAFRIRPRAKPTLLGAHVVLVDDVMTTGATLSACSKTLLRAGAARVDVITLSRVVKAARALT